MVIDGSRLLCCDCTEGGWSDSTDLCSNCCSSTFPRKDNNEHHLPAHTLLQLRQPYPRTGLSGLFKQARQKVKDHQDCFADPKHPKCGVCGGATGEPYWCCMTCSGEYNLLYRCSRYTDADSATYVCNSCNHKVEHRKPWLQCAPELGGSHGLLHTLVLIRAPLESSRARLAIQGGNQGDEKAIRDLHAKVQMMEVLLERLFWFLCFALVCIVILLLK